MRKKLLLNFCVMFLLIFSIMHLNGQNPVGHLTHSWTFEDGTANDAVGAANGTLVGGTISNGAYTTSALGQYINLPAGDIAINTYEEITLEALITAGDGTNGGYTMLAYFGNTANTFGTDGIAISVARGDNVSRTAISCGNEATPWATEDGVNGPELEDGAFHHLVSTIDDDVISFYIDGVFIGRDSLRADNAIDSLSNTFAYLSKGGYANDPSWLGTIHEFNIYNKALSASDISSKYKSLTPYYLTHSYTFEDGTANDIIGTANGTLVGGAISNGAYTTSALGQYINLPAADIAINTYDAITLEAIITAGKGTNGGYTMLAYFGNTANNFGTDGIAISAARGDNVSRTAISCGNEATPWATEDGVNGPELEDGGVHHMVSTIDDDVISFYIDGVFLGRDSLRAANAIDSLSNNFAYLAKGGYSGDPSWLGTIHEFNIYNTALTEEQIVSKYNNIPTENYLAHSYTFEDGTANDVIGTANGTLVGGTISNGAYTTSALGQYINLPAADIAINSYNELTLEAFITAGNATNGGYTMLAYFGNTANTFGTDGIAISAARGDNVSRTAISCGNEATPWATEDGVNGPELEDGAVHHMVSTIDDEVISFYIDGVLMGSDSLRAANAIDSLSNNFAYLSKGGYANDPSWLGTIHEFNIYNKVLPLKKIQKNFLNYSLKHSYTFEDGTANDVIGTANGTLVGGTIADGAYTSSALGQYINLPAGDIAINAYDEVTLEAWITAGDATNSGYTMLAYFGNTANTFGTDGIAISAARGDNVSRTAISCGNEATPWATEDGVNGPELEDGAVHHMVSTINADVISFYIDGELMGTDSLRAANAIDSLSNNFAYLCKGGYANDPSWLGTIHEFNIYDEAFTADEVKILYGIDLADTVAPVITSVYKDTVYVTSCPIVLADYTQSVIATDNVSLDLVITQTPAAGTIISGDSNLVTISVADEAENIASVSFYISIPADIEAPVITSSHSDTILFGDDAGEIKLPDFSASMTVNDNCINNLSLIQKPTAGTVVSGYVNIVTLIAKDLDGNKDSASFNVKVRKTLALGMPVAYADFPFDTDFKDKNDRFASTAHGLVTLVDDTIRGMVASFAGGGSADTNFIDLDVNAYKSFEAVTYSLWFKANSIDTWANIIASNKLTPGNPHMFLATANGRLAGQMGLNVSNGTSETELPYDTVEVDTWYMVTFSQDKSGFKIYVDGQLVNEASMNASPLNADVTHFYIGKSFWPDPLFNGYIDDFRIFDKALSASQVSALFDATKIKLPEPFAEFLFDDNFNDEKANVTSSVYNDVTLIDDPIRNKVASFAGGANNDSNFIDLSPNAYNSLESATYNIWIKATSIDTWANIIAANTIPVQNPHMFLVTANGRLSGKLGINIANSSAEKEIPYTGDIDAHKWYMVTVCQDTSGFKLYVNGEFANSDTLNVSPLNAGVTNFYLGKSFWPDPLFNGFMDHFTIFGESLSDEEVHALYIAQSSGGTDTEAPVISSAHNDVTLIGTCSADLPDYTGSVVVEDDIDNELTVVQSPAPGTMISGLTNVVNLITFDDFANSDTASFNVTGPVDTEDPVITDTQVDTSIVGNATGEKALPNFRTFVKATDNCDATLTMVQEPAVGTAITGETNVVTITVSDDAGNETVVTFNVSVVGIESLSQNGIEIYPNPTSGLVYLKSETNQIQNVKVLDLAGKLLLEKTDIELDGTLDLSGFAGNMFIIRIQTENTTLNTTVVKK